MTGPRASRLEDELRSLRVRDPSPGLRQRVLATFSEAPAAHPRREPLGWGVDMALTAGILLALVLTAIAGARPEATGPRITAEVNASVAEACRALDRRPQDWECRRLAAAGRASSTGAFRFAGAGAANGVEGGIR